MKDQETLIRILIADDHPVVRDGLAMMLGTQPDFAVVGQAASGRQALQLAQVLRPDVICLDLEMPDLDGVQVLETLQHSDLEARVIVFTAYDDDERILSAVRLGARGYLLKGSPREELFRAIRVVYQGGSLLEPLVVTRLMDRLAQDANPSESMPSEALTEREMEVLALMAQGRTNREIASELFVTERTVKFHVSSILSKLNASNRTEAVSIAAQEGLVNL
ncbi:MAG: response regulator [Anaerolineales bacterium]